MGLLTNEVLIATLEDWQDVIVGEDEADAIEHPQFHDLMRELETRQLIDTDWRWTRYSEMGNMDFARLVTGQAN